jgi:3-deoxy-D-manno-octulosonic-acid transferase
LPVLLLNARLSARSAARYRRFHGIFRLLAGNLTHLACQHQDDAERFKQLGIAETKISVTGSIKFDIHYDENLCSEGKQLRQKLGYQRPVWIAASTHEGEDEQVLKAHHLLLKHVPDALLILVPRHPQRFNNVAALAKSEGFILIRRSQSIVSPSHFSSCQVYLGDTMGELPLMFASADIAFVGGSLVDRGGHNLLEPAALSMPVLTGPSTFNFSYIVQQLINAGGAQIVIDYTQLSIKLNYLFSQHEIIKIMGKHAKEVVSKNTGSLNKSLEKISALLDIKKQ